MRDKLRAVGKPGSVAAAAVANRYTRWLYHRMTEHETEQKNKADGQLEDATGRSCVV